MQLGYLTARHHGSNTISYSAAWQGEYLQSRKPAKHAPITRPDGNFPSAYIIPKVSIKGLEQCLSKGRVAAQHRRLGYLTAWQHGFIPLLPAPLLGRVNNCRAGNPQNACPCITKSCAARVSYHQPCIQVQRKRKYIRRAGQIK